MREEVIAVDELQILLNLIDDEISIMYPLYSHFQLLTASATSPDEDCYRLKIIQREHDFEKQELSQNPEMPSYNDFIEYLLASGILGYENKEDFAERLKHYKSLKKKVYFCPDTNIIYHRFISSSELIKPSEILFVETVREEIEASLNFKYSPVQIAEMKRSVRFQPFLLDEFVNRRMKKSRIAAYIALREYRTLKAQAVEVEGVEKSSSDKEGNDMIIEHHCQFCSQQTLSLIHI